MKYIFFITLNISVLYSMQESTAVKDAFHQLDQQQQKLICQSIKQDTPFSVFNDVRSANAVHMIKIQDDGRVKVFKGKYNTEVLLGVFATLCQ